MNDACLPAGFHRSRNGAEFRKVAIPECFRRSFYRPIRTFGNLHPQSRHAFGGQYVQEDERSSGNGDEEIFRHSSEIVKIRKRQGGQFPYGHLVYAVAYPERMVVEAVDEAFGKGGSVHAEGI